MVRQRKMNGFQTCCGDYVEQTVDDARQWQIAVTFVKLKKRVAIKDSEGRGYVSQGES